MSTVGHGATEFTVPVYGTIFAARAEAVRRVVAGDPLVLVPDAPDADPRFVWVHAAGGDVLGHLSPDVSAWLAPAMLAGAGYRATVAEKGGEDVASWQRLTVHIRRRGPTG